ncbi:MAG: nucleotidyltransferase substrate binding protein [Fimbriimonas sp.]
MKLDLTSFEFAIKRLEEGLIRHHLDIEDTQIRDGLIQRFEFTYELAHRTLKRYLESVAPTPGDIDRMAFQDLIRTANEQGLLLGEWTDWKHYREMRSRTSHAYDEQMALQVVEGIAKFLAEAQHLRDSLRTRIDHA